MSASHATKRTRLTWVLLALFLALFALILILQWQTRATNSILHRSADDVTHITIERVGAQTIELVKRERWWVTSPVSIPANDQRITPLLTVYTNPDPGYALSEVDIEATGLVAPDISVIFNDYRVGIGNVTVDGARRHALHSQNDRKRVRFVPDWVHPFLRGGVSALADLTVFGPDLTAIALDTNANIDKVSITQAKELVAQQLVTWPRPEQPTIVSKYSASVTIGEKRSQWSLYKTDRYVAMQQADSGYAFILAIEDMPWLPK